jgi:hypothetical protein
MVTDYQSQGPRVRDPCGPIGHPFGSESGPGRAHFRSPSPHAVRPCGYEWVRRRLALRGSSPRRGLGIGEAGAGVRDRYASHRYALPAPYVCLRYALRPPYMRLTCVLHALYMRFTCALHALYMRLTCAIRLPAHCQSRKAPPTTPSEIRQAISADEPKAPAWRVLSQLVDKGLSRYCFIFDIMGISKLEVVKAHGVRVVLGSRSNGIGRGRAIGAA